MIRTAVIALIVISSLSASLMAYGHPDRLVLLRSMLRRNRSACIAECVKLVNRSVAGMYCKNRVDDMISNTVDNINSMITLARKKNPMNCQVEDYDMRELQLYSDLELNNDLCPATVKRAVGGDMLKFLRAERPR